MHDMVLFEYFYQRSWLIDILRWGHAVFQGFDVTSFQLR